MQGNSVPKYTRMQQALRGVTSVTVKCGKVRTSGVKSGNLVGLLARDVAGSVVKFPESEIHFSHHDDFSADRQSGIRAEKQD